jgi:hypothetical protein
MLDCRAVDLLGYQSNHDPAAVRRFFGWPQPGSDDHVWRWVRRRARDFVDAVLEAVRPMDASAAEDGKDWVPASVAVKRAAQAGFEITLPWLSKEAEKLGIKTRSNPGAGKHRREVNWSSLAGYLLLHLEMRKEKEEEDAEEGAATGEGPDDGVSHEEAATPREPPKSVRPKKGASDGVSDAEAALRIQKAQKERRCSRPLD